mgnify:CR=1 FL=1
MSKLKTGPLYLTRGVADRVSEDGHFFQFVDQCLKRYLMCDWGDLCEEDAKANDAAFRNGDDRILASYKATDGTKLWIITECDRSATTVLFPDEY